MAVRVKENDALYRKFAKTVSELKGVKIAVGIFEADGKIEVSEGTTLIEVAVINEFGGGHVPSRSFIRAWVDEHRADIRRSLFLLVKNTAKGDNSLKPAVKKLAVWMQGEMQKRIAKGIPPANKPSTVNKKGSSKPLIDTGQLRASITYAIDWGDGSLIPVKSGATKKRESNDKAAARSSRSTEKRAALDRIRDLRKKTRDLNKRTKKEGALKARETRREAKENRGRTSESLTRTSQRTSPKYARRIKRIAQQKRRS